MEETKKYSREISLSYVIFNEGKEIAETLLKDKFNKYDDDKLTLRNFNILSNGIIVFNFIVKNEEDQAYLSQFKTIKLDTPKDNVKDIVSKFMSNFNNVTTDFISSYISSKPLLLNSETSYKPSKFIAYTFSYKQNAKILSIEIMY